MRIFTTTQPDYEADNEVCNIRRGVVYGFRGADGREHMACGVVCRLKSGIEITCCLAEPTMQNWISPILLAYLQDELSYTQIEEVMKEIWEGPHGSKTYVMKTKS